MPRVMGRRRFAAAAFVLVGLAGAAAAARTYPDPEAPSVPLAEWRTQPGVRTLVTELGTRELTIPLQAVTAAFMRRGESERPDAVVALWVEATLPDLRTVGADTLDRFRAVGDPGLLWLRLHAEMPPGILDRFDRALAEAIARGQRRLVASGRWRGVELYARPDSEVPAMEGFYVSGGGRRYVECRLDKPPGTCTAVYQRPDGLTVEYGFGMQYLERLEWVDGKVGTLLAGFVTR